MTTRRTVVITGASSGIGAVAAHRLSGAGADVAVVGRNPERTAAVADAVGGTAFLADFDRLDDVRALADALLARYERIDVLANNAGGLVPKRRMTSDGHERTIQSNHLAPFLLTNLLLPRLRESAAESQVRVVSTASGAHHFGRLRLDDLDWQKRPWLGGWRAYGTSKIATILFVRELAERMTGTGVHTYSFHPGFVSTRFGTGSALMSVGNRVGARAVGLTAEKGAMPLTMLAGEAGISAPSGVYFDRMKANAHTSTQARDAQLGRNLWALSARMVGLDEEEQP